MHKDMAKIYRGTEALLIQNKVDGAIGSAIVNRAEDHENDTATRFSLSQLCPANWGGIMTSVLSSKESHGAAALVKTSVAVTFTFGKDRTSKLMVYLVRSTEPGMPWTISRSKAELALDWAGFIERQVENLVAIGLFENDVLVVDDRRAYAIIQLLTILIMQ